MILGVDSTAIVAAAQHIRSGGIVAHPTETCYGFACDLRDARAVLALFSLKRRPHEKPVSGLFSSVDEAKTAVIWSPEAERLAQEHLPGPLTIILPVARGLPLFPTPEGGTTLGVRISSHPVAQALAQACGFPISTTSANIHGQSNPYSVDDLRAQFGPALEDVCVLDGGVLPPVPPSTVVDLVGGSVVRGGTVDIDPHALPPV